MIGLWLYIASLGAALLTAALVTPLVVRFASRAEMVDPVGGRHTHSSPVPRLGGPAVFAAMLVGLLVARGVEALAPSIGGSSEFYVGILLGAATIFVGGLVDDFRPLRPRWKVAWQVAAALVVYAFGFRIQAISMGEASLAVGWVSLPLTLLWIVGVTNAYNLIDGLDGLATGIALVALSAVAIAAGLLGNAPVVLVACILIGALLGFIRYNLEPARIFLGDSGSQFIGFMLAVLSMAGAIKSSTAIIAVVPLFALALPLLDTTLAIGRRWLRGVPVSVGDARHIHHRLLSTGLSKRRAVQVLYLAATLVAAIGLFLAFAPQGRLTVIALGAAAASAFLLLRGLRHLRYEEFAVAGKVLAAGPMRARRVIRDRLYAQEIAEIIGLASSRGEVEALLADNADTFGFAHMEICRESEHTRRRWNGGNGSEHWKLDFPLVGSSTDPVVLRIWCHAGDGFRPFGAERVAHALAPSLKGAATRLDNWQAPRDSTEASHEPEPFRSRRPLPRRLAPEVVTGGEV